MKGGFLHWEPLWFTTSFLWRQSHQNMCQAVEQEWWCPVQVERAALLREKHFFNIILRQNQIMFCESALSTGMIKTMQQRSPCAYFHLELHIAVVNELFSVLLGSQWMLDNACRYFHATSYKPEGRSLPPSHWDNISLSAPRWNEVFDVCVLQKGGGSKSSSAVKVAVTFFFLY